MSQGPSRGSYFRRTHVGSLLRRRRLRCLLQIGPHVTGSSHSSPLHSSTSCLCPADTGVQGEKSQHLTGGSSIVSSSVVVRWYRCASVREELRARGRRWCSWGYGLHGRWTMTGGTCRSPPHNIAPDTSPHLHHDLPALTHTHPQLTPLFATPLTPARRPHTNSRTYGRTHTHTHIHARVHTCTGFKQKKNSCANVGHAKHVHASTRGYTNDCIYVFMW